jgi:hypothetical protein
MAQYDIEIEYPPAYAGKDAEESGELDAVLLYANWRDDAEADNGFSVAVAVDDYRFSYAWDLADASAYTAETSLDEDGHPYHRNVARLGAQEGINGNYFKMSLTKRVPVSGLFEFWGFKLLGSMTKGAGIEHFYQGGSRSNAWPT